eukprot:9121494-Alexandrium_andersonii.AAC.1
MSASLVGSEMCIRDSEAPSLASSRTRTRGALTPGSAAQPLRRQLRGASVSYTHLTLPTICSV